MDLELTDDQAALRDGAVSLLDGTLMIPYVIPGIVMGIAFIATFNGPPLALTGTWIVIVLVIFIRRLPYAVRATAAALKQVQTSGAIDQQAIALRDAMRVLFPEAVALVSAARQGFMHQS